ncbi:MAG: UDP-N-acetylmuramoyl-L-alanyl-D-glutamate--2,6-diaminopimelate ligase [bacterium]
MKGLIKKFIPKFLIGWYHFGLVFLAAIIYGRPSKKIKVIGVTGTDGKSTTVHLIAKVLEEAGYKTALMSSISFKIGEKELVNKLKMTMPGRFVIQRFLSQAIKEGCEYVVLEVSSEGTKQHRHEFIDFEAAVFTNLSPEHIESHGGFENYKKAKGKLFEATKNIHVINLDDENTDYFWQFPAKKKFGYKISDYPDLKIKLLGEFNKYNALAAIYVGLSQGIGLEVCKKAVENFEGIPGRMEMVIQEPFRAIVDYAVTPNALEKAYQAVKPNICVLGSCGGGRDKWKRKVLGEIAGKYCDEVIVTDEDPYDENPMEIIEQVANGAGQKAKKILDRREAIKKALNLAKVGDTVIITGKGCEPWMCVAGGKKIPWDDRRVAIEEFRKLKIVDKPSFIF